VKIKNSGLLYVSNWKEIYENASGSGISGFTFNLVMAGGNTPNKKT
jgi:hypothetical protein